MSALKVNCKAFLSDRYVNFVILYRKRAPHSVIWEREIERERVPRLFVHAFTHATARCGYYLQQESYLIVPVEICLCSILEFRARPSAASTQEIPVIYIFAALNYIYIYIHAYIYRLSITRMNSRINFYCDGNEPQLCLIKECNYIHFTLRQRFFTRRHKSPRFNPRVFSPSLSIKWDIPGRS